MNYLEEYYHREDTEDEEETRRDARYQVNLDQDGVEGLGVTSYDTTSPSQKDISEPFYANLKRRFSRRTEAGELVNRQKSLVRPERARTMDRRKNSLKRDFMKESIRRTGTVKSKRVQSKLASNWPNHWVAFSYLVTFYAPVFILKWCGKHNYEVQQAWREKMALVTIIILMCSAVGFLTFGLQQVLCSGIALNRLPAKLGLPLDLILVNGQAYSISQFYHPSVDGWPEGGLLSNTPFPDGGGLDNSFLFQMTNSHCRNILSLRNPSSLNEFPTSYFPCVVVSSESVPNRDANPNRNGCHIYQDKQQLVNKLPLVGDVYYTWDDIKQSQGRYLIYNGGVLDLGRLDWMLDSIQVSEDFERVVNPLSGLGGMDVSFLLANQNPQLGKCMNQILKVGVLDTQSIGCISSNIILYISLIVIIGVVLVKFFMALFFGWVLSRKLGTVNQTNLPTTATIYLPKEELIYFPPVLNQAKLSTANSTTNLNDNTSSLRKPTFLPQTSRFSIPLPGEAPGMKPPRNFNSSSNISLMLQPNRYSTFSMDDGITQLILSRHRAPPPPPPDFQPYDFPLAHTLLLVTCYSEGEEGLRITLDSLASTDYPSSHKLIYVVCDGIITGSGNPASTPDICLSMMKDFIIPIDCVDPHSYVAIADGKKRHNRAKVYAGYYNYNNDTVPIDHQIKVPMVLIVKVGNPGEVGKPKPGNRGKRDSQMILMTFLQRIMFDERLGELDHQLFNAIWSLTGVPPDSYEIVLMVDADTKVYTDSLTKMVAVMVRDPLVMGLCGETKIANKTQSWVTMIQVFEYYISHHMSKAFESVFGGVTCLPGCFCMYRIKAPKGSKGYWVPILANPDIVEYYSENVVDTLHKKNLLLLGEDRYLSTLMLRTFPKRKMLFVPQAICKTMVPDEFKVLLSQRRRWINSTVHNLLELVLIRDLCGTFCFSMQFVIFMELVGTVVLPAAIAFTIYLIVISFFTRPVPVIPLVLLAIILGLPAVLITLTSRKFIYVAWMLIYLLSLPIWNFVLPVYAYWHFDDFSWGQTRLVEGEVAGESHGGKDGEFDSSDITMHRWMDFEREKLNILTTLIKHKLTIPPSLELMRSLDKLGYLAPNTLLSLTDFNQLINQPTNIAESKKSILS